MSAWLRCLGVFMLVLQACSSSRPVSSGGAAEGVDNPLASMSFNLAVGPLGFEGKSVGICGTRDTPASPIYFCDSELPLDTTGVPDGTDPTCPCFGFDASGGLTIPGSSTPVVIDGLCPSTLDPNSPWTFTYNVYDSANCTGAAVNAPGEPVTCYDSANLATLADPNGSNEDLTPGDNVNHIICVTSEEGTATKEFEFLACGEASTPADVTAGDTRYVCGCTETVPGTCDCGNTLAVEDMPGCTFEPLTCDLLCTTTATAAAAGVQGPARGAANQAAANLGAGSASCPSGFFASCRTGAGSQLQSFDPGSIVFSPLGSMSQVGVGALAFNPRDGFLYGVSSRAASPGPAAPRLLRIDPHTGAAVELDALPQLAGAVWTSGAFLRDGTYVIGSSAAGAGGFRWAKISITPRGPATLVATGRVQATGGTPTWWSAHPTDGRLYGYLPQEGQLVIFSPATNTLSPGARLAQIGPQQACAGAFSQTGELLLYCGSSAAGGSSVYSVDVARGVASLVQSGLDVEVESLTSCSAP